MSIWPDHSRGHEPAKAGDHARYNVTLRHNRCGELITTSTRVSGLACVKCNDHWRMPILRAFTDDQMAVRFYRDSKPQQSGAMTIVWITEGKNRFSRLVPVAEAEGLERFVL